MSWSDLSLKRKLLLSMAGALLLSMALSTLVTSVLIRSSTVERISDSEIPVILDGVAAKVAAEIESRLAVARTMSANVPVNSWLANGETEDELPLVSAYLKSVLQQENAITAFLVSGESGHYYTEQGLARTIQRGQDDWFYNFIDSGKPYSLDLDIDDTTQVPTLFINFRIPGQNAITGIGMEVGQLSDFIRNYQVGRSGQVYLVDGQGEIKIHPQAELSGKALITERPSLAQQQAALLSPEAVQVLQLEQPTPRLVAAGYISSLKWYVVAELPTDELFAALREMTSLVMVLNLV
ncbi:MAG: cache domain-containing protein, partial [Pseudomonadota bacterium]